MSDVGLGANLDLNITDALRRVDQLGAALGNVAAVRVQVDTSQVAPQISAAVDAADGVVAVEPDTAGLATEITGAVDAADSTVEVTGDAAGVTGAIDGAVDAADTGVIVTADTGDVTGSIEGAVDSADAAVVVTADAADVTGSIDGAVQAADTNVIVTGDATEVTGSVTAAVDAADTNVSVTGTVDPGLGSGVEALGDSLDAATTSGIGLKKVLAGLTVGAAAAGLKFLADSASDLAESTSKAGVVFGDEFPAIERFAVGAADAVGLSTQAALEAAGTFGNLFQALGSSREEAARLSPQVVQLAGDLASFNNIGTDEALEKLRSGLVGEIEPLRALGVSFNATDVERKALELGIGTLGAELTEGEKVQARFALITEQTTLAQGDFARTSEGLANQQRILRAELANTAAAAGTALVPAFQALIVEVRNVLPDLALVAADVLPALGGALENLAPLIGVSVDLLIAFAPAIEAVADLLAAIPDEAIAVGAGLLIANKAFGALSAILTGLGPAVASVPGILRGVATATPAAVSGVGALGGGVQGLATSIAALNPLTVAAGVFGVGLFSAWRQGQEAARNYRVELDELSGSLETIDGFQQLTTAGIAKYVEEQSRINAKDQVDDLNALGISFSNIATFAQRGAQGQLQFVDALVSGGDLTRVTRNEYGELITATGDVVDANSKLGKSLKDVGFGQLVVGNTDLVESYSEVASVTEDVAKRQIEVLQAQDLLTDAQVRFALGTDDSGEATRSYAEALNDLEPLVVRAGRAAEETLAKYGPLADGFLNVGDALARLGEDAPEAEAAIAAVRLGGVEPTATSLVGLATTLDAATLSEEQLADAAVGLGTDVTTLKAFIEATTEALTTFVDAALGGLPTVAGAFRDANDDSKVSAREFIDGLAEDTTTLARFIADLNTIISEGFTEVAGTLASQGVEAAGVAAAELANAARDGSDALLVETQAGIDARDGVIALSTAFLRDVLGPDFVAVSGQVGSLATDEFAGEFTIEEQTRIKVELAALTLDDNGRRIATIAAIVSEDAAREYGEALNLDERTITEAIRAGTAIRNNAPTRDAHTAGVATAFAYQAGFIQQLLNDIAVRAAARKAAGDMSFAFEDQLGISSPSTVAMKIGGFFMEGLALGFTENAAAVVAAAESVVRDAVAAAEGVQAGPLRFDVTAEVQAGPPPVDVAATETLSPDLTAEQTISSQFAVGIGGFLMEGLALGITNSGSEVVAAAETIARDAVDAVARVAPEVTASITVGGGATGGQGEVTESLIRALEAVAASGGRGETLQFSPTFNGGDVQANLREATLELRAIARRFW